MIISENGKPPRNEFEELMRKTDEVLNGQARRNGGEYYSGKNGIGLELDVVEALKEAARNTRFNGTIHRVSGASFPDIVLGLEKDGFYGVEVKSTSKNHWNSIGSSILESTRIQDIRRIFLTFGKLGNPVEFKSRPYEECLSGIAVTHYPRYQIDMNLKTGQTIFDKMGVSYETLRQLENPVAPVSKYYKSRLRQGESLWWASNDNPEESMDVPLSMKMWNLLDSGKRAEIQAEGVAMFPEVVGSRYDSIALWLVRKHGVIHHNLRDLYSAGGQWDVGDVFGKSIKMPAVYRRIHELAGAIVRKLADASEAELLENWNVSTIGEDRVEQWCRLIQRYSKIDKELAYRSVRNWVNGGR